MGAAVRHVDPCAACASKGHVLVTRIRASVRGARLAWQHSYSYRTSALDHGTPDSTWLVARQLQPRTVLAASHVPGGAAGRLGCVAGDVLRAVR